MFARAIDHASRECRANPHYPDAERAKSAMELYARQYPELAAKLDDGEVTAAIAAWWAQRYHWKAIHTAYSRCLDDLPTPRSMASAWDDFPHMKPPKSKTTAGLPNQQ